MIHIIMIYRTLLINHDKDFSSINTDNIDEYTTDTINIIKDLKIHLKMNDDLILKLDICWNLARKVTARYCLQRKYFPSAAQHC